MNKNVLFLASGPFFGGQFFKIIFGGSEFGAKIFLRLSFFFFFFSLSFLRLFFFFFLLFFPFFVCFLVIQNFSGLKSFCDIASV